MFPCGFVYAALLLQLAKFLLTRVFRYSQGRAYSFVSALVPYTIDQSKLAVRSISSWVLLWPFFAKKSVMCLSKMLPKLIAPYLGLISDTLRSGIQELGFRA